MSFGSNGPSGHYGSFNTGGSGGGGGGGGTVTAVTASSPLASSGGTTPNITINAAFPSAGANLTNADATINPATDGASQYTLPAATLTADHVLTLGTGGTPGTNFVVDIVRRDLTAHSYTIKDDTGTTLITAGPSPAAPTRYSFFWNGAHYAFLSSGFVL